MPFSSQPRSKKPAPQGRPTTTKPCGHAGSVKDCPECRKAETKKPAEVIDLPTQKKQTQQLVEKISQTLHTDTKGLEKAAFVLSRWLTRRK